MYIICFYNRAFIFFSVQRYFENRQLMESSEPDQVANGQQYHREDGRPGHARELGVVR